MKLLLVFAFLYQVHSTDDSRFSVHSSGVEWHNHVQAKTATAITMLAMMKLNGRFERMDIIDTATLTGWLLPFDADYKGAGYSEMSTPMYIARSKFSAFVIIKITHDGYDLTVRYILADQDNEKQFIEKIALTNDNRFTAAFLKKPATILDFTFSKILSFMN